MKEDIAITIINMTILIVTNTFLMVMDIVRIVDVQKDFIILNKNFSINSN